MAGDPIPTYSFALVVVRSGDRFLIVQERKFGQSWYVPGGRVELGETLAQAAERETLEESGIRVRLTGVLRVEHTPFREEARLRAVFLAEPIDDAPPKQTPDKESLRAEWVTLDALSQYPLRGADVEMMFRYVAEGGVVFPLEIIQREGLPFDVGR
jgi:8-oxo-dGTP pyrophosphatase MutT (NUDIX family)